MEWHESALGICKSAGGLGAQGPYGESCKKKKKTFYIRLLFRCGLRVISYILLLKVLSPYKHQLNRTNLIILS